MTSLSTLIAQHQLPPAVQTVIANGLFERLVVHDRGREERGDRWLGICERRLLTARHLDLQRHWDSSPGTIGLVGRGWDWGTPGETVMLLPLYEHQTEPEKCKLILMQAALRVICKHGRSWHAHQFWPALKREARTAGVELPIIPQHKSLLPPGNAYLELDIGHPGGSTLNSYDDVLSAISVLLESTFAEYTLTVVHFADEADPNIKAVLEPEYALQAQEKAIRDARWQAEEQERERKRAAMTKAHPRWREWPVTKEELSRLVWEKPVVKLAEDFGVSNVAISKHCKKVGIQMPPRGYWNKPENRHPTWATRHWRPPSHFDAHWAPARSASLHTGNH